MAMMTYLFSISFVLHEIYLSVAAFSNNPYKNITIHWSYLKHDSIYF